MSFHNEQNLLLKTPNENVNIWLDISTNPRIYLQNNDSFDAVRGTLNGATLTIECENVLSTATIDWMVIAERCDDFVKRVWDQTDENGYLVTEYNG